MLNVLAKNMHRLIRDHGPRRSLVIIGLTLVAAAGAYWAMPADMGELPRRTAAIFVIAVVFWATEVLPLFATSLCIIGLQILMLASHGGLAPEGEISYAVFLEPFSSSVIILFLGGFLLSAAVTKHGLDRAIAARFLKPFTGSPITMLYGVLGITAFFSMWISNTATTAMMLAIIAPLLRGLPPGERFHRAIILAVPFGANIGGMATPIGTPPNAVALAALREAGYPIGFADWMMLTVPLVVVLLFVVGQVLYWFFRPLERVDFPRIQPPQKLGRDGVLTLVIMGITIALWLTGKLHGVNAAVVALLAAAALTAFGVLEKRDVDTIDWNILILMWGGLSLGNAMFETGMVDYIVALPIRELSGVVLAGAIVLLSILLSTFISNTATANLLVPLAIAVTSVPAVRVELTILCALSCSAAMAMPVSTAPNALAFATGQVPVTALIRTGALIGFIAVVLLLLGYQFVLPMFIQVPVGG